MLLKSLFRYWTYQILSPGTLVREKYEAFKTLLEQDKRAHELIAELEELRHGALAVDIERVASVYEELSAAVGEIVANLRRMTPSKHLDLEAYYRKFDFYVRFMLHGEEYDHAPPFAIPLTELDEASTAVAGGKAAHLAAIGRTVESAVPAGFVVTTSAFHCFLEHNALRGALSRELAVLDPADTRALARSSERITRLVRDATVPPEVERALREAYAAGFADRETPPAVAVRSSAVAEDGRASFAGQYATLLNIPRERLADAYKDVVASKYSPEALYYRIRNGLSDLETPMAVLVLEMIDAEASGVIYTRGVESPTSDDLEIHATWGLGELLVQGEVSPDVFRVRRGPPRTIVGRRIATKPRRLVPDPAGATAIEEVEGERRDVPCLRDEEVLVLAGWGERLEAHAGEPQDVEWCRSADGRLHLLQTRSLGVEAPVDDEEERVDEEIANAVLLEGGDRASPGVGAGEVCVVRRLSDLDRVPDQAVLVARAPSSRYVRVLDKLRAVVTDTGSPAGHFASVAREFGVPVLVDTGRATTLLEPGRTVTVHADGRRVYAGVVPSVVERQSPRRATPPDSTFVRKLGFVLSFVSPLRLIDPDRAEFIPSGCRSMHDIIRFAHEMAVREMFTIGDRKTGRKMGAKKLELPIPLQIYVLDVGGGLVESAAEKKAVDAEDLACRPFRAVLDGLRHPDIQWSSFSHFDWEEYDRIVMSGGIISADSAQLASYAVLSSEYLNLNLKFGYHFVIIDTICGDRTEENHILFRFTGGGGDSHGRSLRAEFLCRVLERLGFETDMKGDLVDARFQEATERSITEQLDRLGRLLGASRLMDMYLKEEGQVEPFVDDFMNGRYHFSTVALDG